MWNYVKLIIDIFQPSPVMVFVMAARNPIWSIVVGDRKRCPELSPVVKNPCQPRAVPCHGHPMLPATEGGLTYQRLFDVVRHNVVSLIITYYPRVNFDMVIQKPQFYNRNGFVLDHRPKRCFFFRKRDDLTPLRRWWFLKSSPFEKGDLPYWIPQEKDVHAIFK